MKTTNEKRALYRTAKAIFACAWFKAGEHVSVEYWFTDEKGMPWYVIKNGEHGKLGNAVAYPENHLTSFCL